MAGIVESTNFSGSYSALNGMAALSATHADIIRSLLTVGYPSRKAAIASVGAWRARMLVAMATGYLDGSLKTTKYFRNLEQTEKVGVSFLLGEAFTHWYAQERMGIDILLHVSPLKSCVWSAASGAMTLKAGATTPPPKSRPDFIGLRPGESHVFESKGRMRAPSAATVGKALGQVSAVRTVNGANPTTRCASFFMLKATGAEGKVVDPPGSATGIDVTFDEDEAVAEAYRFFLEGRNEALSDDAAQGYLGRVIEPGVFFGIDKHVLAMLPDRPQAARQKLASGILDVLSSRREAYLSRRGPRVSAGRDGTLLLDNRELGTRRRVLPQPPSDV